MRLLGLFGSMKSCRFSSARDGNVALLVGLLLAPLALAAGMAVDFGRAGQANSMAQEAADAAVLRVARAKTMNPELSDLELTALARKIFNSAMMDAPGVSVDSFRVAFDPGAAVFTLSLSGGVATSLLKVAGVTELPLRSTSAVRLGDPPYMEVALALDVTGSMNSNGKIDAMKKAASELVESVFSSEQADAKVGLVPFAQYANVGEENESEPWLAIDDGGGKGKGKSKGGGGSSSWKGCVGSRHYPANLVDAEYATRPIPGVNGASCPDPIVPLTDDKTALLAAIDRLDANGWTYIPAGLAWGWRVLSSHAPFTGGLSYKEMAERGAFKSLIVLTDGDNTRAPDYPTHESSDKKLADAIMMELCDSIKGDGIVIYTIAFDLTDAGIRDLLEKCASSSGNHFDAQNSAELSAAFRAIGASMRTLSLSK
jgi:Flp pilus assembly protein TadG